MNPSTTLISKQTPTWLRVVMDPLPALDRATMGKWISFMPATWEPGLRQTTFENLARAVMQPGPLACPLAKMAWAPLHITPDQVALMFYTDADSQQAVFERVERATRQMRQALRKDGHLAPRSPWLSRWTYKTDEQTRLEMEQGTHVAQVSRMMEMLEGFETPRRPKP